MDPYLQYLHDCVSEADFVPYPWDGEDRNIRAFASREDFLAWYCQPPGNEGEPYRDRGFYCRELAAVSCVMRPKVVVEFGTSLGIGTCLLRWLNPDANLITVDVNTETFMPGDRRVPIGFLARHQGFDCLYAARDSREYTRPGDVELCFIDGDHSYESVLADSRRAWKNRNPRHWCIVWHDYNERHLGVMKAVQEFCREKRIALRTREDSDTVWAWSM